MPSAVVAQVSDLFGDTARVEDSQLIGHSEIAWLPDPLTGRR
jgi:hypothetical protein